MDSHKPPQNDQSAREDARPKDSMALQARQRSPMLLALAVFLIVSIIAFIAMAFLAPAWRVSQNAHEMIRGSGKNMAGDFDEPSADYPATRSSQRGEFASLRSAIDKWRIQVE